MKLDKQQLIILGLSVVMLCGFGVFQYIPLIRQKHAIQDRMAQQDQLCEQIISES